MVADSDLRNIYTDLLLEDYLELEEFVARAQTSEFGNFSRDDIVAFLREMELNAMNNIETQLAVHPHWEAMKEQAAANVQRRIQELVDGLQERSRLCDAQGEPGGPYADHSWHAHHPGQGESGH